MLTDLLPGKAAAKMGAGVLVPVIRGLNKDPIAAASLLRRAATAEDMLKQGATLGEVLEATQLHKAPGTYHGIENPKAAKWLHNVAPDPERPVWRSHLENPATGGAIQDDMQPLSDMLQLSANGAPGAYENLWRQYPELLTTNAQFKDVSMPGKQGEFFPSSDEFIVYGNSRDPLGTANHELSHAIMTKTGQLQNAGFQLNAIDKPRGVAQGFRLVDLLRDEPGMRQIAQDTDRTLNMAGGADPRKASVYGWNQSSGERLADFSSALDKAALEGGDPTNMRGAFTGTISDAIPRALGDALFYLRAGHNVRPDEQVLNSYTDLLRKRNLLPP